MLSVTDKFWAFPGYCDDCHLTKQVRPHQGAEEWFKLCDPCYDVRLFSPQIRQLKTDLHGARGVLSRLLQIDTLVAHVVGYLYLACPRGRPWAVVRNQVGRHCLIFTGKSHIGKTWSFKTLMDPPSGASSST